ncbi:MAG: TlyA family RNA methyltransferase [Nitrospinae bacterium]|nr:TlyA family RNA methyltransferase [Nitrospinota bacterium]
MAKKRLDQLLADRGLAESRARARALIMAGAVTVSGARVDKPGAAVDEAAPVQVAAPDHPYVSRGGVKLAHALDVFGMDPAGKICLDIGASTGGFTDCLLQRGAAKVWAVDVGTNQLSYKLRSDPRVVSLEKTNARELDPALITDRIGLLVADVSFISLRLAIPPGLPLLEGDADMVLLVKPQFEAGRENVGKGGVVRDPAARQRVVEELTMFFEGLGWYTVGACESPITGPAGNVEYFIRLKRPR